MGVLPGVLIFAICCVFINAAPFEISNGNNKTVDEPVKELESLKEVETKPLQLSFSSAQSSVFSNVNGRRQGHTESQKQLDENGKLVVRQSQKTELAQEPESEPKGKTETELEIPSENIHRASEREEEPEAAIEKLNAIEYSPLDMAEYVFWTGDEKGVTLAIEDFLQGGLMTREDAINFLQSIKSNLDYIQAHYQGLRKIEEKLANRMQQDENNEYEKIFRKSFLEAMKKYPKQQDEVEEKPKRTEHSRKMFLNRLRGAQDLTRHYALDEVIYQLAKFMLSRSLSQGSLPARQALHRFTDYLEKEVEYGQISKELEKQILDVLLVALSDTLGERPDLLQAATEGFANIEDVERISPRLTRQSLLEQRNQDKPIQREKKLAGFRSHGAARRSLPATFSLSIPHANIEA